MRAITVEDLLGRQLSARERKNAPNTLYVEGPVNIPPKSPRVCVIGTRVPTRNGIIEAELIAGWLADQGATVVSGLAAGIDAVAHETTISKGGQTIAVLGTPLDKQYPKTNAQLQAEIASNHLLVSQFPLGHVTTRADFVLRNKTMALISDVVVIVEAGEHSGTIHAAREAIRLGRPLFVCQPTVLAGPGWLDWVIGNGVTVLVRPKELLRCMRFG